MAQSKDFYDYQMAVDYVTAKEKGDTKRGVPPSVIYHSLLISSFQFRFLIHPA